MCNNRGTAHPPLGGTSDDTTVQLRGGVLLLYLKCVISDSLLRRLLRLLAIIVMCFMLGYVVGSLGLAAIGVVLGA